jgi:hypothetical protein
MHRVRPLFIYYRLNLSRYPILTFKHDVLSPGQKPPISAYKSVYPANFPGFHSLFILHVRLLSFKPKPLTHINVQT